MTISIRIVCLIFLLRRRLPDWLVMARSVQPFLPPFSDPKGGLHFKTRNVNKLSI